MAGLQLKLAGVDGVEFCGWAELVNVLLAFVGQLCFLSQMITSYALGLGAEFMVLGRFFPCLGVVSAVLRARGGVETLRELCLYEFMVAGFRLALEGEIAFRERAFLSGVLQELELDLDFQVRKRI